MIKEFKFFRSNETRINWQLTGLLDDATNVPLLIGVLDITYKYIVDNNLMDNDRVKNMLIIVMYKLYRDKYNSYSDYDIRGKINQIATYLNSVAVRRIIQELQAGAWMSIDVGAETQQIIYERCKWDEDTVGEVFHNNADTTLTFRRND
jgi:transposase